MKLHDSIADFNEKVQSLVGKRISAVEYLEIIYDEVNPQQMFNTRFKNVHSIDFSIILHTECSHKYEITWDGSFFQYGIGLAVDNNEFYTRSQKWDVSNTTIWQDALHIEIADIDVTWEKLVETDQNAHTTSEYLYPQDMKITFHNSPKTILISAAGFLNETDESVCGMLDNLTVTDDLDLARKINMARQ